MNVKSKSKKSYIKLSYCWSAAGALESVPNTEAAFPRCTANASLCFRNAVERVSPVTNDMRRPISLTNASPVAPHVPIVYMATGTNSCAVARAAYFATFFDSASLAVDPASADEIVTCDGANVSGQVASHRRQRPRAQGTRVTPSGRFPPPRSKPGGSRIACTPALCSARKIPSLSRLWRRCLPALRLHARP